MRMATSIVVVGMTVVTEGARTVTAEKSRNPTRLHRRAWYKHCM